MAGRPVTVRSSHTVLLYWVIVFAILSVVSLGLFIFQLTNNKAAVNEATRAREEKQRYGNPPQYYQDEARSRNTNVFAAMVEDLRRIAAVVTGNTDDVGLTVIAKCEQAITDIAGRKTGVNESDTLLTALTSLDRLHTDERQRADRAEADLADVRREKDSLTAQLKATRDQFEAQVATLTEQLRRNEEEKINALQQKDQQLGEVQTTLNAREQELLQIRREGHARERDLQIEIGLLQTQVGTLQDQLRTLKQTSFDPNAILTKADGKILRAVPGSDLVYVNVGTADKIKVGMRFEVYSRTREPTRQLRGKASLEVVTVMEDTAECRVSRREAGQPIIDGDIIVNIAYERNRQPKFVVRGEFDLDYDGIPDADGPEQVRSLIREWGGQVVADLDESVDFVVVGQSPGVPTFADDEMVSDIVRDQMRRQELAGSEFAQLLGRAASMYIPVVTQNQFLFLTGYAGETVVAQR